MSESMNRVIKDLQQWKEAPVDCMVLALYQLQTYYVNEIRRGFAGCGEYTLLKCYSSLKTVAVNYIPSRTPNEIVIGIKNEHVLPITQIQEIVQTQESEIIQEQNEDKLQVHKYLHIR